MKKENIFKQKLYHHTSPVREGLWEAIEAQLPPKKEQKVFPFFWLILFGATLVSGMLIISMFDQRQMPPAAESNAELAISSPKDESTSIHSLNQQNEQTEQTLTTKATESNNLSEQYLENGFNQESKAPSKTEAASITNSSTSGLSKSLRDPVRNDKKTTRGERTNTSSHLLEITTNTKSDSDAGAIPSFAKDNLNSTPSLASPLATADNSFAIIPFLPQQELMLATEESMLPALYAVKPDPNCYKFSGTGSKLIFSIDVFAGPGFSPKTFEQLDSESSIYADARIATEDHQYGWSAGARLNLQHRSGFTGRIGLSYTQAGDIFDYTDSLATQSTTRIDSFFAADGTFLYTETSQVLILGTLIKKIHNTYRYLDIPLIIGYEMPMGRSTFLVNAGPVINVSTSHSGQILDPNLHPRSIKEGDPGAISVYKSNIGLSLYLGAGYLFPISDHFSGLIEPTFVYRLSPVTLPSYPLREQRHYAGLNLGIRYHIH